MNALIDIALVPLVGILRRSNLLADDLDYKLVRGSMVIMFLFFGYQKWWAYEAKVLIPFIEHGPLIWWLYPVFGVRGASWFLGVAEWTFGALIFAGYWNKRLGVLGALGSVATFVGTVTIIPFMPNGWDPAAGYSDAQLVEISLAFATTVFTNVFNRINDTDIDFPALA